MPVIRAPIGALRYRPGSAAPLGSEGVQACLAAAVDHQYKSVGWQGTDSLPGPLSAMMLPGDGSPWRQRVGSICRILSTIARRKGMVNPNALTP